MGKLNFRLAIPLQCLVLSLAMVLVFPGAYTGKSLRGISGVTVQMDSSEKFMEYANTTKARFKMYAELTLRKYRVKTGAYEDMGPLPGILRITIQTGDPLPSGIVYLVHVDFHRSIKLPHLPQSENEDNQTFRTSVWNSFAYGIADGSLLKGEVRERMDELVERFVNDLLSVN